MNYNHSDVFESLIAPHVDEAMAIAAKNEIPMIVIAGIGRNGYDFTQVSRVVGKMSMMSERMIATGALVSTDFALTLMKIGHHLSMSIMGKMSGETIDEEQVREMARIYTAVMRLHILSVSVATSDADTIASMFKSHDGDSARLAFPTVGNGEGDTSVIPEEMRDFLNGLFGRVGDSE